MNFSLSNYFKALVFSLATLSISLTLNAKPINYTDGPNEQLLQLISLYANHGMPQDQFLQKVKELIKKGANPNAHVKTIVYTKKIGDKIFKYKEKHWTSYTYTTPFHMAVSKKNITLIEKLIELGAKPDKPDRQNTYPIDLALEKNDTAMVFCLLKHGANIKRISLNSGIEREAIIQLIKMGANPNNRKKNKEPVIERFLRLNDKEIVLLMIDYGVDAKTLDLKDCSELNLIEELVKRGANSKTININIAFEGEEELKRVLALKPDLNNSALDYYYAFKNLNLLNQLLDSGLNINSKIRTHNYPLIFGAVEHANVSVVEELFNRGASLNSTHHSTSLLQQAIKSQRADMLVFLLKKGAKTDKKSNFGESLVIFAASYGNADAIEILIKEGLSIESKSKNLETPLIVAAKEGQLSAVEELIKHKANINYKTPKGKNALIYAIELNERSNKDKFGIIKHLAENGADLQQKYKGLTIINYAERKKCHPKIIEYLKKPDTSTIPLLDFEGDFSKYDLSRIEEARRLERYVKWGANPKTINLDHFLEDTMQLKKVLALQPELDPGKLDLSKVLKPEVLPFLLKSGFNISAGMRNDYQVQKFINKAIINSDTTLMKLLIMAGLDINQKKILNEAIDKENLMIVTFLLQSGANANGGTNYDRLPLTKAIYGGNHKIIESLLIHGADPLKNIDIDKSPIIYALKDSSRINAFELLVNNTNEVDATDKKGQSLLEYAIEYDNTRAVQLLIEKDAKLLNDKVITPLHQSFLKDNTEIINLLIKAGAKINTEFSNKGSLLTKAVNENRKNAAITLIKNGADVNYKPRQGKRPLFAAIKNKDLELIKLLIESGAKTNVRYDFKKPYAYANAIRCPKEILDYLKQFD